ncbi:MAG: hypothetical protein ACI9RO_000008 [Alteromonas macleodii]|jgi:hypothetical protein
MKSNFALSLSFEGLRLLHRVADGWHLVGQVALDDDDLTGALDRLRVMAKTLEPSGILTKVLIPNDQIKYLTLDTIHAEEDDVRQALHQATPYEVDDLVYDYVKGGGRTYVAAVAKETLTEAKQFSAEHGFNPVSFAAVPEPFTYVGEAFFGCANGTSAERDADTVIIIGEAALNVAEPDVSIKPNADRPPKANIKLELRPDQAMELDSQPTLVEAFVTNVPEINQALTPDESELTSQREVTKLVVEGTDTSAFDEDVPQPQMMHNNQSEPTSGGVKPAPEATDMNSTAKQMLSSRLRADRNEGRPASTQLIKRQADKRLSARAKPTIYQTAQTLTAPTLFVPLDKSTNSMPPLSSPNRTADTGPISLSITTEKPKSDVGHIITGYAPTALLPDAAVAAASLNIEAAKHSGHGHDNNRGKSANTDKRRSTATLTFSATSTVGHAFKSMFSKHRFAVDDAKINLTKQKSQLENSDTYYNTNKKSEFTILGARKKIKSNHEDAIGGKPRFLGLILTAALLLFLLTMAAVAALSEEGFTSWFGFKTSEIQIASDTTSTTLLEVEVAATKMADDTQLTATHDTTNPFTTNVDQNLATGGQILTPEKAARLYAAIGVWQRAPRIPQIPRTTSLNTMTLNVSSHPVHWMLSSPLTLATIASRDTLIAGPINPPPPSQNFNYNTKGLVVATAQGAMTPDGTLVTAGRPPLNPPTRPNTLATIITSQNQLVAVNSQDTIPTHDTTENMIEVVGRPTVEPPIRPGTLALSVTPEISAFAFRASLFLVTDDLLVLTGSPPVLPPVRPGTIAPFLVIAPETVVPATSPEGVSIIARSLPLFRADRQGTDPPQINAKNFEQGISSALTIIAQVPTSDTLRPLLRPSTIFEDSAEIATTQAVAENTAVIGMLNVAQSATFHPRIRPANRELIIEMSVLQPELTGLDIPLEIATTNHPNRIINPTTQAVPISNRPDLRPRNMERIVSRAIHARERAVTQIAAAIIVPQTVPPSGPTAGPVAQSATLDSTINLHEMNLIGIYGGSGDRRALVRMNNGRYVRVTVGDRLDGGHVTAISATALNYTKRGRAITLRVIG